MSIMLLFLWGICAYFQIYQHSYYFQLSQKNRFKILKTYPKRGLIRDRNGKIIATNIPSYQLLMKTKNQVKKIK